jgi:hypothetical protein
MSNAPTARHDYTAVGRYDGDLNSATALSVPGVFLVGIDIDDRKLFQVVRVVGRRISDHRRPPSV